MMLGRGCDNNIKALTSITRAGTAVRNQSEETD